MVLAQFLARNSADRGATIGSASSAGSASSLSVHIARPGAASASHRGKDGDESAAARGEARVSLESSIGANILQQVGRYAGPHQGHQHRLHVLCNVVTLSSLGCMLHDVDGVRETKAG